MQVEHAGRLVLHTGGGTGTLARDVLDHLRGSVPEVYEDVEYCSVEISPHLAQLQKSTVADAAEHSNHYKVPRTLFWAPYITIVHNLTVYLCTAWRPVVRLPITRPLAEQVELRDAAQLDGWDSSRKDEPCFFLLMEVLDNCPHDRIYRESSSQPWLQTAVVEHQVSPHQVSPHAWAVACIPLQENSVEY